MHNMGNGGENCVGGRRVLDAGERCWRMESVGEWRMFSRLESVEGEVLVLCGKETLMGICVGLSWADDHRLQEGSLHRGLLMG